MRDRTLDIMKGITILLVVVYHSIITTDSFTNPSFGNPYVNIVTSFFMPCFFIISGYVTYGKVKGVSWFKNKAIRFGIPIIVFTIVYGIIGYLRYSAENNNYITEFLTNNLIWGFSGFIIWYIWTLVLCYGLILGVDYLNKNTKIPLWAIVLGVIIILQFVPIAMFGINPLKWWSIFFLIGYTIKAYKFGFAPKLMYGSLLLFPLACYLTNWMQKFENIDYGYFGYTSILTSISVKEFALLGVTFGMAVLGTMFIWSLSKIINRIKYLSSALAYLGVGSIVIYLVHMIFIHLNGTYYILAVVALAGSIVTYELTKRNKITRMLVGIEK